MKSKKRNTTFDILRALSILWVVAIWHIADYNVFFYNITRYGGYEITILSLSIFSFLSGFLLSLSNVPSVKKQRLSLYVVSILRFESHFLKKRFVRVVPLLLLAILCLNMIDWFYDYKQILYTILGLSLIFPPAPSTLWYISMLLCFYLFTPFLLICKRKNIQFFTSLTLGGVLAVLVVCFGSDERILFYYIFYAGGILINSSFIPILLLHKKIIVPISVIVFVVSVLIDYYNRNWINLFFVSLSGLVLTYYVCKFISNNRFCTKLFSVISYASMAAYLFHRIIYHFFFNILNHPNYPLVAILFVFICSFYIQKLYDWIMQSKYKRKC